MCGRFALTAPASTITEIFQVDVLPDVLPRYNVAPTTQVLCIVDDQGQRTAETFRWGLIPFWAKDTKVGYSLINARSETVGSKPAFRTAFQRRRLLVVADGFYEWKRDGKVKVPHLIGLKGGTPFAMAGLWERWTDPATADEIKSCTIVTTDANDMVEGIHDRMPVILPQEHWSLWLDPSVHDKERLSELLVPYPSEGMAMRRVSSAVNSVKNHGPECQAPWEGED